MYIIPETKVVFSTNWNLAIAFLAAVELFSRTAYEFVIVTVSHSVPRIPEVLNQFVNLCRIKTWPRVQYYTLELRESIFSFRVLDEWDVHSHDPHLHAMRH